MKSMIILALCMSYAHTMIMALSWTSYAHTYHVWPLSWSLVDINGWNATLCWALGWRVDDYVLILKPSAAQVVMTLSTSVWPMSITSSGGDADDLFKTCPCSIYTPLPPDKEGSVGDVIHESRSWMSSSSKYIFTHPFPPGKEDDVIFEIRSWDVIR